MMFSFGVLVMNWTKNKSGIEKSFESYIRVVNHVSRVNSCRKRALNDLL